MTMLRVVLPELLRRRPEARLRIIGRGASPELVALAGTFRGSVSLEGYVEDLDKALSGACALLMPLRFGSGVKIKVIEALARGLPVVTTPLGAEGLPTGAAEGLVLTDVEHLADAAAGLIDPLANAQVGTAGRRFYERTFEPSAAARLYDPLVLP
jgi:glycosyltransferase involved in cell wall biosynthesis